MIWFINLHHIQTHSYEQHTRNYAIAVCNPLHVRQWFFLRKCYDSLRLLESQNGHKYDAFVRLRDDSFIAAPIEPTLLQKYKSPTIIISNCETWRRHAINDKGALLSRNAAHKYFILPLEYYYFHSKKIFRMNTANIISPEVFLNHVYGRMHHVNLVQDITKLPIITSRRLPSNIKAGVNQDGLELGYCLSIDYLSIDYTVLRSPTECYIKGDTQRKIKGLTSIIDGFEKFLFDRICPRGRNRL